MILIKLGQHVNEIMAVAVKNFRIFSGHVFLKSDKTDTSKLTWTVGWTIYSLEINNYKSLRDFSVPLELELLSLHV